MVRIQDDLFNAVNQQWLKKAKIRPDMPTTGSFVDLSLSIEKNMRGDLNSFISKGTYPKYLKNFVDLYKIANNWEKREKNGQKKIKQLLSEIEKLHNFSDFSKKAVDLDLNGYPTSFEFGILPDFKQADKYIFWVGEPDTILPDSTYYKKDNPQKKLLLNAWSQMTDKLLTTIGYHAETSKKIIADTLKFDAIIAKFVLNREEQSQYYKNYHPKTLKEFSSSVKSINLKSYVEGLVGKPVNKVVLSSERFWKAANSIYANDNWDIFKNWLIANAIIDFSAFGSYKLYKITNSYSRILTGTKKPLSPSRAAYFLVHGYFGFLIGEHFRKKYFSPEAKANVENMVKKMINVYQDRLKNNHWLGEETIKKALKKLNHISIKIGYPDKIPARFLKRGVNQNKSLIENCLSLSKQENKFQLSRWNKKVDTNEWDMTPDTVNAYYDPQTNSINFPAGILQKPFYNYHRNSSANYGGIGAVIAHETSHAFDNNGAKFDEKGSLNNWWTKKDLKEFEKRSQSIVKAWTGLKIDDIKINPKLILGENIADLGGLSAALQAAKENKDFSPKIFFITWATIWRMKSSKEYIKFLAHIDEHAPNKLRANEPVKNFQEFFSAFNIKPGDKMFRPKSKRVSLW